MILQQIGLRANFSLDTDAKVIADMHKEIER